MNDNIIEAKEDLEAITKVTLDATQMIDWMEASVKNGATFRMFTTKKDVKEEKDVLFYCMTINAFDQSIEVEARDKWKLMQMGFNEFQKVRMLKIANP